MDLDGGSSSTVSTGVQAIPGRPTRHGGGFYFLFWQVFNCFLGLGIFGVLLGWIFLKFIFMLIDMVQSHKYN